MNCRKLICTLVLPALLLLCAQLSFAQGKTVTGRVTEANGSGVAGVTVAARGENRATSTNENGQYSITVNSNSTVLVFSSVGFTTQEQRVGDRTTLNVSMAAAAGSLSEVVVVGYGTQRRREVTGAISKVSSEQITAVSTPSFEASLQGRVPGVQVSQSSLAGGASYVRIRGIASVSAGGDPLYVIDGIPVTSDVFSYATGARDNEWKIRSGFQQNPLAAINPNDIESIEVLKDAGAAGIYGSRGANGVILITTKRGRTGKPKFNFSSKVTTSRPSVEPKTVNSEQWLQLRQEAWENDGNIGTAPLPYNLTAADIAGVDTDWWDLLTRTGVGQDYSLSMSVGGKKLRYFVSGNFSNDESFAIGNNFKRFGLRNNFDFTISPKLKSSLNLGWNRGINYRIASGWAGGIGAAMREALPILKPYNNDGSYFTKAGRYNQNPIMQINEMQWRSLDDRYLGGLSFDYQPINNLTLRATGNLDYFDNTQDRFESSLLRNGTQIGTGGSDRYTNDIYNYNTNLTATYNHTLNENNKLTYLLGTEYQYSQANSVNYFLYDSLALKPFWESKALLKHTKTAINYPAQSPNVPEDDWKIADRWSFISYFGRINYSFQNKLYVQALARVDGSSKFGPNNRFGFFPSVSAAYILTEDDYFRDMFPFFSNFKLRTSYGITGNANIPSFKYLQTWTYNRGTDLYNGQPILYPNNLENPDLKWETLNNFDAGLEFGLLKGRLTGEVAYYNKRSKDVLLEVNLSPSIGLGSRVFRNLGKVMNQGVELSANFKVIDTRDFSFSVNANAARNYNEVLDLKGLGPDDINTGTDEGRLLEGYPLGTRYSVVYLGVDPADGLPIYMDREGKSTKVWPGLSARRPIGKNIPDWVGGFGANLTFKGFELNTLFVYAAGLDIWDNSGKYQFYSVGTSPANFREDYLDHWRQPGDVTRYPKLSYANNYPGWPGLDNASSSMLIQEGDYLRMRELTLGYRLPQRISQKANIQGVRLFVTGTNLLLWTKYTAGDPEINRDADGGVTSRNMNPNVNFLTPPQPKSVTFGLNVTF